MNHYARPHATIPGGTALTDTSIDELIRSGLRLAFPLPARDDPNEDRFRRLLDALARCRTDPLPQPV